MKKIYKNSSTEGNLARVNLQRREMKATLPRFSPVFSRVKQPAHQSLSLSTIRTSVPEITVKLKTVTVPDMLIIHLMQNMASVITAVADVLLPVKQLAGSQPVQLQKKILEQLGIDLIAFTRSIGDICIPETEYRYKDIAENMLYMPNNAYAKKASDYLESCMKNQDSSGGIVECRVKGMPAGIGETVFDKLDASLAKAVVSIGAVKGVEIGDGFEASKSHGSSNNDAFTCQNGAVIKKTNHAGGILGGMSDGSELILRAAFKPTPSISKEQQTINTAFEDTTIAITGRHDPVVVPRAVVVVESMAAITILDQMMINMSAKMDALEAFYCKE